MYVVENSKKVWFMSSKNVTFKRNKDYEGYECWFVVVDDIIVGTIERPQISKTRVDAFINNKNIYSNGFDSVKTAKMYIKDFINFLV